MRNHCRFPTLLCSYLAETVKSDLPNNRGRALFHAAMARLLVKLWHTSGRKTTAPLAANCHMDTGTDPEGFATAPRAERESFLDIYSNNFVPRRRCKFSSVGNIRRMCHVVTKKLKAPNKR